jgi:O-acetyl-ADP-ribose deacetylase (regulator of RNase III)
MEIKYKVGCLIEAAKSGEVDIIAHQANCQNTMNSGIAPLIRESFPEAWEADCKMHKGNPLGYLGKVSWGYEGDLIVFNLYGQDRYGKGVHTNYTALRSALYGMEGCLWGYTGGKIGLPKLGAGHGGGDWRVIETIIIEELCSYDRDVTIYVLTESEIPQWRR